MNILTFDIEDWWVYDHYRIGEKSDWRPRLDGYLNRILDLLDERNNLSKRTPYRMSFFFSYFFGKSNTRASDGGY